MKRLIVKRPRVEQDLTELYAFIALDKSRPAERFLTVAEESFARLAESPAIGLPWKSKRPSLRNIQFYPMPAPYRSYIIFYRATDTLLDVIAVIHGSRDQDRALGEER